MYVCIYILDILCMYVLYIYNDIYNHILYNILLCIIFVHILEATNPQFPRCCCPIRFKGVATTEIRFTEVGLSSFSLFSNVCVLLAPLVDSVPIFAGGQHSFRSWIWHSELLVPHISIQYIYILYTRRYLQQSRQSWIGFLAATQSCLRTLVLWNDEKSYLQMMKNPFREWICRNYLNDNFPYPGKVYFLDLPNLHMAFFGMPSVMGLSWFWRPLHSDIDYSNRNVLKVHVMIMLCFFNLSICLDGHSFCIKLSVRGRKVAWTHSGCGSPDNSGTNFAILRGPRFHGWPTVTVWSCVPGGRGHE